MERSIINDWSTPKRILHIHDMPLADSLKKSDSVITALRSRWPNPIEATIIYKGSFNRLTTWTYQLLFCFKAAAKFISKRPFTQPEIMR